MTKKENFVPEPLDKNKKNDVRHESMTSATTAKWFGGSPRHKNTTTAMTSANVVDKDNNYRQKGGYIYSVYIPFGGCYYGIFGKN